MQFDEPRPGDVIRQIATGVDIRKPVADPTQHERRHTDRAEERPDIEVRVAPESGKRLGGTHSGELEAIPPSKCRGIVGGTGSHQAEEARDAFVLQPRVRPQLGRDRLHLLMGRAPRVVLVAIIRWVAPDGDKARGPIGRGRHEEHAEPRGDVAPNEPATLGPDGVENRRDIPYAIPPVERPALR